MKYFFTLFILSLAFSLPSFAESLIPNPQGPKVFEDLIGMTISLQSSESFISDLYWEAPDTIWIKKVKNPKEWKHYTLSYRKPYHGTLTEEVKYSPINYDSFSFRNEKRIQIGITPSDYMSKQCFIVVNVTREIRGRKSLAYSNDYRTKVVQLHLRNKENGDLIYWDVLETESKSFGIRRNYTNVKISIPGIADNALHNLTTREYYLGDDYKITGYLPSHIDRADYVIESIYIDSRLYPEIYGINDDLYPELNGKLYFSGKRNDGREFTIDNASPKHLITPEEYSNRMQRRFEALANAGQYKAVLSKVRKPANSKIRNGKITKKDAENNYLYEDNYVFCVIGTTEKEVVVSIKNKTDYTMKILWDEAAFVSPNGTSQRVIHSGVALKDKSQPQAPSIIPGQSIIHECITPCENIRFSSAARGWIIDPLIAKVKSQGQYSDGTIYSVLLPIQIEGVTNEYIFVFELCWVYDNPEIREEYLRSLQ